MIICVSKLFQRPISFYFFLIKFIFIIHIYYLEITLSDFTWTFIWCWSRIYFYIFSFNLCKKDINNLPTIYILYHSTLLFYLFDVFVYFFLCFNSHLLQNLLACNCLLSSKKRDAEQRAESTQSRRMSESSNPTSQYSRKMTWNETTLSALVPLPLVTVPLRGHRGIFRALSRILLPLFTSPLLSSLFGLLLLFVRGYARAGPRGMARGAESKGDKIYKYVGGARDPFQCLFNQE